MGYRHISKPLPEAKRPIAVLKREVKLKNVVCLGVSPEHWHGAAYETLKESEAKAKTTAKHRQPLPDQVIFSGPTHSDSLNGAEQSEWIIGMDPSYILSPS